MLNFSLDNFSGPLELLLYLIQKDEMAITDIPIHALTTQFIDALPAESDMDTSAETLGLSATLLLMKSQKLLPKEERSDEEMEGDPRIEMIQQLIDYCHFRDAAKQLSRREELQRSHFARQVEPLPKELGMGLEEVGIEDLQTLFLEVMSKAEKQPKGVIHEEHWHVSDKITWLRARLAECGSLLFGEVFHPEKCRGELIVCFLALLELMKHQVLKIVKNQEEQLFIFAYEPGT